MLYELRDVSLSFGDKVVLSHIGMEIKEHDKIGIVGANGAGKTTLMRLLLGELEPDRDDRRSGPAICASRKITTAYLSQIRGDEHEDEPLSGGQKTQKELRRVLDEKPDLLLLDEPTNHLDVDATEWLEKEVIDYPYAVVMISHDRYFLDRVATVIYELADGKLKKYVGNYSHYKEEKRKEYVSAGKRYRRQQEEILRLKTLIDRFKGKPTKAAMARAKRKQLERMELISKPEYGIAHIYPGEIVPDIRGPKRVWECDKLKVGYKDKELYELTYRIQRGQKIGLIGPNGSGKSTLLKIIAGIIEPISGKQELGQHITLGYFDQNSAEIESDLSVVEHMHSLYPVLTDKEVRQELGRFLFSGKDAAKRVSDLSGGERARLVLCELLKAKPNFLILDEPTNHMDIPARETIESALRAYTGTIIAVSHDRYFISKVAESILTLEDEHVMYYPFGYEHYMDRKNRVDTGDSLAAQIDAESQALIAGIKAVPKAERHRLREIPTELAYVDWQKRLMWENCERTRTEYEKACELLLSKDSMDAEEIAEIEESIKTAEEKWTQALIEWDSIDG